MIFLSLNEVLMLHRKLILKTGGSDGLRDIGMLELSILNCMQTFDDIELYPSIEQKAARTAFSICNNHPFVDGNKRTAVLCMLMILNLKSCKYILHAKRTY